MGLQLCLQWIGQSADTHPLLHWYQPINIPYDGVARLLNWIWRRTRQRNVDEPFHYIILKWRLSCSNVSQRPRNLHLQNLLTEVWSLQRNTTSGKWCNNVIKVSSYSQWFMHYYCQRRRRRRRRQQSTEKIKVTFCWSAHFHLEVRLVLHFMEPTLHHG